MQWHETQRSNGKQSMFRIKKTFRGQYFLSSVYVLCNTFISPWFFSKIHSSKQKLLRRRTTRKHRYTVFLLPVTWHFYLGMLTNSWCMGICRRLCSHRNCRVIKCRRETSVGLIVIHYLPLFDLCLSNALLLPVVSLVWTTFPLRIFRPVFTLSRSSCGIINICNTLSDFMEII